MNFLETNQRPGGVEGKKKPADGDWPLPEVPQPKADPQRGSWPREPGPHFEVLIALAIKEDRPNHVLDWYERYRETRKGNQSGSGDYLANEVADAVAETHPQRALDIYRRLAESYYQGGGYECDQVPHLQRMRDIFIRLGREKDWTSYLAGVRATHGRKRNLMAVLDRLEREKPGPGS